MSRTLPRWTVLSVSLALVVDRKRIVTIVAFGRAQGEGFVAIGGGRVFAKSFPLT